MNISILSFSNTFMASFSLSWLKFDSNLSNESDKLLSKRVSFWIFFSSSVCEFANSHFFAEVDVIFFAFLECIWFFLHSFQVSHWRDQNHNQITCERWLKKSLHFANKVALCISCTTILAREVTIILHLITSWKRSLENPGAFFFAVISKACFIAMTGDRHDEPAATDPSMIAVALTPTWLEWILTVMPVWLYSSSFLFFFVLFLNTKLYMLYEFKLCLILITIRKLAI